MNKKHLTELREKSTDELKQQVKSLKKDMAKLAVETAAGKKKNVSLISQKKKNLAQILTIIREKELVNL